MFYLQVSTRVACLSGAGEQREWTGKKGECTRRYAGTPAGLGFLRGKRRSEAITKRFEKLSELPAFEHGGFLSFNTSPNRFVLF